MVKMLTFLVSTIFNSQVFLMKINVSSFCKYYSHFFSAKHISIYAILMSKVLTIRQLKTSLVLDNCACLTKINVKCVKIWKINTMIKTSPEKQGILCLTCMLV